MNKITIRELEKRLMAAEKNSYKNEEKNFDNLLKELTSKNKREISDLQKEMHNLNNKIVTKVFFSCPRPFVTVLESSMQTFVIFVGN